MNNLTCLSIFYTGMALGTSIVFSSSHWVNAWLGVEINTLAILPLMLRQDQPLAVKAITNYFTVQAVSAMVLPLAVLTNTYVGGGWFFEYPLHPAPSTILVLGLALKLGVAPLHFWLPEVSGGLDSTTGFLVLTWQKVTPLLLLVKVQSGVSWPILLIMGLLSVLIGGWGAAVRGNTPKILVYCSITYMGWMVVASQIVPMLVLIVYFVHCILATLVFLLPTPKQSSSVGSVAALWINLPAVAGLMPLTLFSLAYVHPFTVLLPKWGLLTQLTEVGVYIASAGIDLTAVCSFLLFLRMLHLNSPPTPSGDPSSMISWRPPYTLIPGLVALAATRCLFYLPMGPLYATLLQMPVYVY